MIGVGPRTWADVGRLWAGWVRLGRGEGRGGEGRGGEGRGGEGRGGEGRGGEGRGGEGRGGEGRGGEGRGGEGRGGEGRGGEGRGGEGRGGEGRFFLSSVELTLALSTDPYDVTAHRCCPLMAYIGYRIP